MASQPMTTCLKGLFLIFNFVFWVTGLGLLVIGILTKFSFGYLMKLSTSINYDLAPYIMIGCGCFIVLVGFIGCWAAVKEHGWALKFYMFILIVLFICELVGAVTGYILRNKLSKGVKTGLENGVHNYYKNKDLQSAMDKVQSKILCCGVDSYTDYFANSTATNKTVVAKKAVPKSCCDAATKVKCQYLDLKGKDPAKMGIYKNGCFKALLSKAKGNFLIVGGVALGIAVFQVLGVICAFILTKQFAQHNYEAM